MAKKPAPPPKPKGPVVQFGRTPSPPGSRLKQPKAPKGGRNDR